MNGLVAIGQALREQAKAKVDTPSALTQFNAFIHRGEPKAQTAEEVSKIMPTATAKADSTETQPEATKVVSAENAEKVAPKTLKAQEGAKKRGKRTQEVK